MGFNPALFNTPTSIHNLAVVGLDMSQLNWAAANLSYYNSSKYLADVSQT